MYIVVGYLTFLSCIFIFLFNLGTSVFSNMVHLPSVICQWRIAKTI